jgi:hypothetical protein
MNKGRKTCSLEEEASCEIGEAMLFDKCLISSSIGTEQRHRHRFPCLGKVL